MADKNFIIRCHKCRWAVMTTGLTEDIKLLNLKEFTACASCSGGKKFKCPTCGNISKMTRIKGNV